MSGIIPATALLPPRRETHAWFTDCTLPFGNVLPDFPADSGIFPGNTRISVDVVRHVPASRSPIPRSSSATADPPVAGDPARNLTVNAGSTERTR